MTEFLQTYPDIAIRLTLADRLLHLRDDHIDLSFRIGVLPDSSLLAIKVGSVRGVVCASPAYLTQHGTPVVPEDLGRHQCVTFTGLGNQDRWDFGSDGLQTSVRVRSRLIVNTAEAAIDAAIAGLGLTRVLSYQIAAAESFGNLVTVLKAHEPAAAPISLIYDGHGALPVKLRAFLDFAAQRLKERLPPQDGP